MSLPPLLVHRGQVLTTSQDIHTDPRYNCSPPSSSHLKVAAYSLSLSAPVLLLSHARFSFLILHHHGCTISLAEMKFVSNGDNYSRRRDKPFDPSWLAAANFAHLSNRASNGLRGEEGGGWCVCYIREGLFMIQDGRLMPGVHEGNCLGETLMRHRTGQVHIGMMRCRAFDTRL